MPPHFSCRLIDSAVNKLNVGKLLMIFVQYV
jgi:hypothetical protein